jgi:hypothetical protein
MSTCRAIAAPCRHPRGEPRSPSPANPSLTAALIPSLPTGQPTRSRRPLTSAAPFPPRSPFIVPGDVGDLGGHGDLDARPASPHAPARFVATPDRLLVAPRVVRMNRRDLSASLQVHYCQQLRASVAKSEFRDTWPSATQFALLFTINRSVAKTDFARGGQQNSLAASATLATLAGSPKPALLPRLACCAGKRNKLPRRRRRRQVPLGAWRNVLVACLLRVTLSCLADAQTPPARIPPPER